MVLFPLLGACPFDMYGVLVIRQKLLPLMVSCLERRVPRTLSFKEPLCRFLKGVIAISF